MAASRSSIEKLVKLIKGGFSGTGKLPVYEERVVIIHSPFKTGTTTIAGALVVMGFADMDHGFHRDLNRAYKPQIDKANRLAIKFDSFEAFRSKRGKKVITLMQGLLEHTEGYKIFGDVPFGHLRIHPFVKKLIMPNARFIWIDRDEDAWFKSAQKWHLAHPEIYPGADKSWAENPAGEKRKLIRLRENGFKEFRKLQKVFPEDCLVISLEKDAQWQPLCDFLNLPVPTAKFPVLNKAKA
ncbi:MAG: hypothetical protein DRR42_03670 [Gammaproteobacteria bacterium]|nr:MAG: hypothetical protein DRR42_03670 [Gammaproteobacteria bacterium]